MAGARPAHRGAGRRHPLAGPQPGGPAKVLVISEEWSSDCRRDVPMAARLAEAGWLELRIFTRDSAAVGRGSRANPAESPDADLVNAFLNYKDRRTFQSIPVIAFFPRELDYLCHYIEFPRNFLRDSVHATMQAARPGESRDEVWARFLREWGALQQAVALLVDVGGRGRRRHALRAASGADRR